MDIFVKSIVVFWKVFLWVVIAWWKLVLYIFKGGMRVDLVKSPTTTDRAPDHVSKLVEVRDFGSNHGELRMWTYNADSLSNTSPLVVVLHGSTQTADAFAEGSGWLSLAKRHGFTVLCPEQTKSNSSTLSFNWFRRRDMVRNIGEPASIYQMIQHCSAGTELDEREVYVCGLSSGGAMTSIMLATYPEVFLGGAVIAGLPFGAATTLAGGLWVMFAGRSLSASAWGNKVRAASVYTGPWPTISIWHGEEDKVVKPTLATALVRQWTNVHGVETQRADPAQTSGRKVSVWKTRDGHPKVTLNEMHGMGHGAPLKTNGPGACGQAGPYLIDVGISSSSEIARAWGLCEGP